MNGKWKMKKKSYSIVELSNNLNFPSLQQFCLAFPPVLPPPQKLRLCVKEKFCTYGTTVPAAPQTALRSPPYHASLFSADRLLRTQADSYTLPQSASTPPPQYRQPISGSTFKDLSMSEPKTVHSTAPLPSH
jgi:hypothetical protein